MLWKQPEQLTTGAIRLRLITPTEWSIGLIDRINQMVYRFCWAYSPIDIRIVSRT